MKIAALVVTYNRKDLLGKCLDALSRQTFLLSKIVIVDNASTDGTEKWIKSNNFNINQYHYIRMPVNIGGAGGFSKGMKYIFENGYDWAWIMDDDALPELSALEELVKIAVSPNNIYGSIAVCGEYTSWPLTVKSGHKDYLTQKADEIPGQCSVSVLPFLGFFIHQEMIRKIGLPDEGFFIAGDDIEYCFRAKSHGAEIVAAGMSKIQHPKAEVYPFIMIHCLKLPPWKRYYDTRNRILIAKRHFGWRWIFYTIPGSFLRLIAALLYEKNRFSQFWAFFAGFFDGVCGIKGMRHTFWRVKR